MILIPFRNFSNKNQTNPSSISFWIWIWSPLFRTTFDKVYWSFYSTPKGKTYIHEFLVSNTIILILTSNSNSFRSSLHFVPKFVFLFWFRYNFILYLKYTKSNTKTLLSCWLSRVTHNRGTRVRTSSRHLLFFLLNP
jgi:hypothetical protein